MHTHGKNTFTAVYCLRGVICLKEYWANRCAFSITRTHIEIIMYRNGLNIHLAQCDSVIVNARTKKRFPYTNIGGEGGALQAVPRPRGAVFNVLTVFNILRCPVSDPSAHSQSSSASPAMPPAFAGPASEPPTRQRQQGPPGAAACGRQLREGAVTRHSEGPPDQSISWRSALPGSTQGVRIRCTAQVGIQPRSRGVAPVRWSTSNSP